MIAFTHIYHISLCSHSCPRLPWLVSPHTSKLTYPLLLFHRRHRLPEQVLFQHVSNDFFGVG